MDPELHSPADTPPPNNGLPTPLESSSTKTKDQLPEAMDTGEAENQANSGNPPPGEPNNNNELPPATEPPNELPPEPIEQPEVEVPTPVPNSTSQVGENAQKLIREFFFAPENVETSWKPAMEVLNSFAASVSKLHPLRDGMTLFASSKPKQNFFTVDLQRTFSTFGRDFEVCLAYYDAKLPVRKAKFQLVKWDATTRLTEDVGDAFEQALTETGIEDFVSNMNAWINMESNAIVVSGSLPTLEFNNEMERIELVVGRFGQDIYTLKVERVHTLDFIDFDLPKKIDENYPYVIASKKVFSAFSHAFVYCSIADLSLVDGQLRPLLSVMPTGNHQSNHYVSLGVDRFSKITFKLTDENLVIFPPTEEKAYVLLHFREKKT